MASKEEMRTISVIIAVLNGKDTIEATIKSILIQDTTVEIIIIDGGSIDGTIDIINHYSDQIAYFETGQDTGVANAFNRGLQHATGDYIAILNSDDYWEPDCLRNLHNIIDKQSGADVYFGSLRYIDEECNHRYIRHPDLSAMRNRMYLFHPSMFVKKTCYERVGGYDETFSYAMDSEWCHRAIKQKAVFVEVPAVLANMRLAGVSDLHFKKSLIEYRKSVIKHQLTTPFWAFLYYYYYLVMKGLLRLKIFSWLRRLRD